MKLSKHIEQFEKELEIMNEVSATGAVGGFIGKSGDLIDDLFTGGFHPDFGELKDLLKMQVDGDIAKRIYTDEVTPITDQDFIDLEWDYDYDEIESTYDEDNFINKSETNMELVGVDINYDTEPEYAGEDFINKSKTNWKLVGR